MTDHIIMPMDARLALSLMAEQSVHTCVTSPPYFGLRDYGHDGQMGLEGNPRDYVAGMVDLFGQVRRVLRDDGTLWLNLGDTYSSQPSWGRGGGSTLEGRPQGREGGKSSDRSQWGLAPKQLLGIPWRIALALQADGWFLRQEIIWHKPNPMPEPAKDRCVKSHEHIFLLSKQPRYYFDYEAIKEPAVQAGRVRADKMGGNKGDVVNHSPGSTFTGAETRNKRSVWTVTTKPFKGAHFATFPPDLIEPCVLAGAPEGGTVLDPFGGAGTTGLVAKRNGRNSILCEINPEYADMAEARIAAG